MTGIEQGFSQIALALFTTLVPSGVFSFVAVSVYILAGKPADVQRERLGHFLSIPLAAAILGLIASTNHLGRPSNTLYVLMGVGRSPLSNEVTAVIVFVGLAWMAWLLSFGSLRYRRASRALLALAAIASLPVLAEISNAYSISTIVSWTLPYTQVNLLLSAPMGGSALALCTFAAAGVVRPRLYGALAMTGACATAAACVSQCLQNAALGNVQGGLATASSLVPFYPGCIAASAVLSLAAWALCAWRLKARAAFSVPFTLVVCTLVLVGVFVVRFAFYCMHLTAGL